MGFLAYPELTLSYGKTPVALVGASLGELMQLVQWFKEAFDLPVLSLEEVDAQIPEQETKKLSEHNGNISLNQVIAELADGSDPVNQP